ncbi:ATP-binding protein [Streptomyces sp. NBC_01356]|uniref:ATP-binding protein n=1 Tax=Streptomyces sp. NBC_01356 TaxID=2903836 RepID=UPI002E2FAD5E|nr:ATP-binding protein [Streptomyces sp. NBC_01356]
MPNGEFDLGNLLGQEGTRMPETATDSAVTDAAVTDATWQLPRTPRSAPHARQLLRAQLTDWQIDGEVAETAELLLTELVTNSLQHACTAPGLGIGLRLATYDGVLRVEVADADEHRPVPRQAAAGDEGGRGLTLIQALAERWGYCPRSGATGKATWAELALP